MVIFLVIRTRHLIPIASKRPPLTCYLNSFFLASISSCFNCYTVAFSDLMMSCFVEEDFLAVDKERSVVFNSFSNLIEYSSKLEIWYFFFATHRKTLAQCHAVWRSAPSFLRLFHTVSHQPRLFEHLWYSKKTSSHQPVVEVNF